MELFFSADAVSLYSGHLFSLISDNDTPRNIHIGKLGFISVLYGHLSEHGLDSEWCKYSNN